MDNLNVGTKEIIIIDVEDRLDAATDLSAYAIDFRVQKEDQSDQVAWTPATTVTLMRVECLVDTTSWSTGHYELYIRITIGSERPILGPFDFNLV